MLRRLLAVVLGVVAAVIVIIAIEALGHAIHPPPNGLDVANKQAFEAYVASLPLTALLVVMIARVAATLTGGLLACFIAQERPVVYASIVGLLVLLGTVINLVSIPHPLWFSISSVAAIVATMLLTGKLGSRFCASAASVEP